MLDEVFVKNLKKNIEQQSKQIKFIRNARGEIAARWVQLSSRINWVRLRKVFPLFLGLCLMLIGWWQQGARNLVGVGTAVIFLTIGLTLFIKGRIRLDDFW